MAKFIIKKAKSDYEKKRWYYILKGSNGETLNTSELYNTKQGAEVGIKAVKKAVSEIIAEESDKDAAQDLITHFPNGV